MQLTRRALLVDSLLASAVVALPLSLRAAAQAPSGGAPATKGASLNDKLTGFLTSLHDPVIIKEGDTYHVFRIRGLEQAGGCVVADVGGSRDLDRQRSSLRHHSGVGAEGHSGGDQHLGAGHLVL